MDRLGTKDHGEREDEEVERLVRPSPKVKPPRHDLRRETVEPDKDLDLDTHDKDLSKNFKDIGGSVGARVLIRWSSEVSSGDKVKVRSKATGWVGWVSKDSLKEQPGAYEVADEGPGEPEPKRGKKPSNKKPEERSQPSERDQAAQAKLQAMGKADPSVAAFFNGLNNPQSAAFKFRKENPGLKAAPYVRGYTLPDGIVTLEDLARVVALPVSEEKSPSNKLDKKQLKNRLKEVQEELVEDPKSEGAQDERSLIQEALKATQETERLTKELAKAKAKLDALEKKGPPTDEEVASRAQKILDRGKKRPKTTPDSSVGLPQKETPATEPAPETSAPPSKPNSQKPTQAEPGTTPASEPQQPTSAPEPDSTTSNPKGPKSKPKNKKSPKQLPAEEEHKPKYVPGQPERAVSSSERLESDRLILKSFPADLASQILIATPPYHPDEVRALVSDYNVARSLPSNDVSKLLGKAPAFYATDPNIVPAPKYAKGMDGKNVPIDELPEAERVKAVRKHQVQTVAMSLAAKTAISKDLEGKGAPEDLASAMSDFMLSRNEESPAARGKRAAQEAENMFLQGLQADRKAQLLSDHAVKNLLQASADPALQKLVVGYCQSKDYQEARKLFLDPKSKEHISEQQSPRVIASQISKAAEFLRKRSERYPDGSTQQDTYTVFRNRVMKHLAALTPSKQALVQDLLEEGDHRHYEKQLHKYEKAAKSYEKQRVSAERDYASDYKSYSKRLLKGDNPDEDPPLNVEDRLFSAGVEPPVSPQKPPNYDKLTKSPEEMGENARSVWKDFTSRNASNYISRRVAARSARHAFSFYSATCAMDRTAVYWGVSPYEGLGSYEDWQQPQARDLGDPDFAHILKAARQWLKTPVLSTNIEGIVRDTQLRAALDLALRAENYDHALHPALYNKLLARLAGVSEDKTLLTVRSKTARNPMSNKKVELETAQADHFLGRLDRIASVVQENHKKWGMDFTAAKNLVNAIDKLADDLESVTYGQDSLLNRQATEIGHAKLAQVIERDSDEKYMETFKNPMSPHQTDANEPYMAAYKDDQSSAVRSGKASNGRPLAK